MSEQTPDHSSDGMAEAEPSMEDILASIRKIIADDADPVPLDGPAADISAEPVDGLGSLLEPVASPMSPAPAEPAAPTTPASADADSDPLDIDALLSGLDVIEPEAPPAETSAPVADPAVASDVAAADAFQGLEDFDDPMIDLDIPMIPDDAAPVDARIPEPADDPVSALGQRAAQSLLATPDAPEVTDTAPNTPVEEDELDALMDELLVELDDAADAEAVADIPAEPDFVVDPAADLLEPAAEVDARAVPELQTDEDMDLVRSLMDDLTDEDASPADPDVANAVPLDMADDDDAILDDILDMTLEDAIAHQPLDTPEPQAELPAEPAGAIADAMPVPDDHRAEAVQPGSPDTLADTALDTAATDHGGPSLSDIAATAEADADAAALRPVATAAALGGAALAGGAVAAMPGPATETEPDTTTPSGTQTAGEPAPTQTSQQETPMPRAVRSDAILDEVTEEAAVSAFAELNQVVEEKAVYSERGPRIGDLVQEALKPMLKEWLDANLKGIVERAVAKEVKRISTGK